MLRQILNISIIILIFFLNFLHGSNIKLPEIEKNHVELTVNLIKKCYPSTNASYLITDSPINSLYIDFYSKMIGAITLVEGSKNFKGTMRKKVPTPLVIMIMTSASKVEDAVVNAKWRNFEQFFIILDGGSDGCDNAEDFLIEAWKNDILKAIFLCWNRKTPQIYTFNPFNSYAPESWKKVKVLSINGRPWTLFIKNFDTSVAECKNLFYGRTSNLGRHSIKIGFYHLPPFLSYKNISNVVKIEGYDFKILRLLAKELNATLVLDKVAPILGHFNNATGRPLLWRVAHGEVDMVMNSLILRAVSKTAEITYPFNGAGLSAITQQRMSPGHDNQLFTFLSFPVAILLLVTCILVFILLFYVFKDPFSRNSINIVSLCLNMPLPITPITTSGRIIFGATVLGFTIGNMLIQAKMDTAMSVHYKEPNVEEVEDLNELNFTVLTKKGILSQTLEACDVRNIKVVPQYINCSQLKKDEAFVGVEYILRTLLYKECHISKHPIVPGLYVTYYTRSNWPIYPKINKKLLMLFEGDLTWYISEKVLGKYKKPDEEEGEPYEQLTMRHVKYTFYLFMVCSFVAVSVFFVELVIDCTNVL